MEKLEPLIFSNKITPSPWNGGNYSHSVLTAPGNPESSNIYFFMDADGTSRVRDIDGVITPTGTWTTTPGTSYEVSSTITVQNGGGDNPQWISTGGFIPVQAGAGFGTQVCGVSADYYGAGALPSFASATFQIIIRKVGTTTPTVVSTINLFATVESNL